MLIRLNITEGPRKGEDLTIKDAIVIGRKTGDLTLRDGKVSNPHARIFGDASGIIYIEDLGSSNGTFVNGQKIESSALKVGDTVQVGATILVIETPNEVTSTRAVGGTWQSTVELALLDAVGKTPKKGALKDSYAPFESPVTLEIIQGIQAGTRFTFGFGPRKIGAQCPDGLLFEQGCPAIAFTIEPIEGGVGQLKTTASGVLLNDSQTKKALLKNGDRISIGHTVIVVRTVTPIL